MVKTKIKENSCKFCTYWELLDKTTDIGWCDKFGDSIHDCCGVVCKYFCSKQEDSSMTRIIEDSYEPKWNELRGWMRTTSRVPTYLVDLLIKKMDKLEEEDTSLDEEYEPPTYPEEVGLSYPKPKFGRPPETVNHLKKGYHDVEEFYPEDTLIQEDLYETRWNELKSWINKGPSSIKYIVRPALQHKIAELEGLPIEEEDNPPPNYATVDRVHSLEDRVYNLEILVNNLTTEVESISERFDFIMNEIKDIKGNSYYQHEISKDIKRIYDK